MEPHPATRTWNDEQKDRLTDLFPDWDIWYVRLHTGGATWCARIKGEPIARINAASPDELEWEIRQQP